MAISKAKLNISRIGQVEQIGLEEIIHLSSNH